MHGLLKESEPQHRGLFVEREHELATLFAALDDAVAGRGSFALITGEPGIGKTRLCAELEAEAYRRGFATLQAVADPLSSDVALAPITAAFADHLPTLTGAARANLTNRLSSLDDLISQYPADRARKSELVLSSLCREVESILGSLTTSLPALLLLDDIEFFDDVTCRVLRHLGVRRAHLPVVLALAGRPAAGSGDLVELADSVPQDGRSVVLSRLSEAGIEVMLSAGRTEPDAAEVKRIAGLPLYARALIDDRATGSSGYALPSLLAARIKREIRRLPEDERCLFEALMVAGDPLPFEILAAVSRDGPERSADALRRLIAKQLASTRNGDELFAPAHPMYAEWADTVLLAHERRIVRAALGRALDEVIGDVEAAAAHFLAAGHTASGPRYATVLLDAARIAEARGSGEDMARYLQPMVDRPNAFPSSPELATRLEDLGRAQLRAGAVHQAEESWRRAMQVALDCEDTLRTESIRYRLAMLRVQPEAPPASITEIRENLGEDEDGAVRDMRTLVWSARFGDARQLRAAAVRLLDAPRRPGTIAAQCAAEFGRGFLKLLDGETEEAHRSAQRAVALAQRSPHTILNSAANRLLSRISVLAGDLAAATTLAEDQLRELVTTGHDVTSLRVWLGLLRYFSGDLTQASEQASQAVTSAAATGAARAGASASLLSALVAAERGQGGRVRSYLADIQRTYRTGMTVDRGLASFAEASRSTLAFQSGLPDRIPDPRPDTFDVYPQVMCLRPLMAGLAGNALTDPERTLRQAAYLRSIGRTSPVCSAFALRLEGLADVTAARTEHGAERLREAAQQLDVLGIRLQSAQTVVEWGESGAAAHSTEAIDLIRSAIEIFQDQGVRYWADRARGVARSLGLEPARSRSGSALTSRELEVAGLVAQGLSNAAIARQLFLSERTVETHMRHIYATLGLSSRVEIARWLDLEDTPVQSG